MNKSANAKIERLNDLLLTIQSAEMYFDNTDSDCCGHACDCYENNKTDLADAYEKLSAMNFVFVDGELYEVTYVDGKLVSTKVRHCCECGSAYVGEGYPIGIISPNNCGNCYGFVDGVYTK